MMQVPIVVLALGALSASFDPPGPEHSAGIPSAAVRVAPGPWEMMPHPSVFRMAGQARAIVEGTATAKGIVTVTKRHLVRDGDRVADEIQVPSLATMPKAARPLGALNGLGRQPIKIESVLLFLERREQGGEWVPMHLIGKAARGVLWFEKGAVWGYAQSMNPGAYVLSRWVFHRGKQTVNATPKEVRAALAAGLAGRDRWRRMLAIEDATERAAALMKWFDPAISPDGEWWRERLWPDAGRACDQLGEAVVKPLAKLVQAGSAEAASAAADALWRQGKRARPAVPSFIARLRDPRGVDAILLLRVLGRLDDPRAADVLRDHVSHRDPFAAIEAAKGLQRLGGQGVVDLLVARLPTEIDDAVTLSVVANMLEVIHDIEPRRAVALVERHFLDCGQLMMQRRWLREIRDRK